MSNLIQIKRSVANSTVTGLANGELAFTQASNTLYVGSPDGTSGSIPIATKLNYGILTPNSTITVNASNLIDTIKIGSISSNVDISNSTVYLSNSTANTQITIPTSAQWTNGNYYLNANGSWSLVAAGVNTSAQYTWTNNHQFNTNVTVSGIVANGSIGSAGQILTSNGTTTYWQTDTGTGTVTSINSGDGLTGGPVTSTGSLAVLANTGIVANSTGTFVNSSYIASISSNNSSYLGGTAAASYQLNSTLSANVAGLTSNNSTYAFGKTEGNLNVNSALTSNNSSYLGGTAAASYQLNSTLSANVAGLTSNNSTYAFGKTEGNLNVNSALTSNNSTYAFGKTEGNLNVNSALTSNNSTYAYGKTEGNLNVNSALTSNNSSYLGGTAAASYQLNSTLSANVAGLTSNNSTYVYGKTEGNLNVNSALLANQSTYILANNGIISNSSGVFVNGNTGLVVNTTGVHVNSSYVATISSNNSSYLGGTAAASYQLNSTLAANVATMTANNSTYAYGKTEINLNVNNALTSNNSSYLNGQLASYYTNATNITTGTLSAAQLPANIVFWSNTNTYNSLQTFQADVTAGNSTVNTQISNSIIRISNSTVNTQLSIPTSAQWTNGNYYLNANGSWSLVAAGVNTSAQYTWTNTHVFQANVTLAGVIANGSIGSAGQILSSNGSSTYWQTVTGTGTVTSVDSGNGLTGGPVTASGTLSILANTGIVANSTGAFVNSAYIATISSNNSSYLGGTAAASYQLNSTLAANVAGLTSNNSTYAYGKTEGNLNVNSALTSNNSSYLGGTLAASYVQNTDSRVLSGNLNFTGTNNYFSTALYVGANAAINTSSYFIGNTTVNTNITAGSISISGITINSTSYGGTANNSSYLGGTAAASYQLNSTLAANVAGLTSNNSSYLGGTAAASYQLNSTLAANVAGLTSNNSTYAFGKTEGNLNVNSALTSNNSTYAFGKTEGNLNVNSALTSNNSTYAFGKTEGNLNVNSALTSNNSTYAYGKTEGNLNVNNALTSNNSSYLGGTLAASYVQNTDSRVLSGNLNFTGTNNYFSTAVYVGANAYVSTTGQFIGNTTVNTNITAGSISISGITINSTSYGGTANNSTYAYGKTEGNLNVNNALTSNNSSYLGGTAAASYLTNTGTYTISGPRIHTANVTLAGVIANGSIGSAGMVLSSNGSSTYWVSPGAASVDQNAQYAWTNTHTFAINISVGNSTVNTSISNTAIISLANSTVNTQITIPTSAQWTSGNYYLNANGSWVLAGGSPAGSNTYIQFNDSGSFGGNAALTFNKTTGILSVGNSTVNTGISANGITFYDSSVLNNLGQIVALYNNLAMA